MNDGIGLAEVLLGLSGFRVLDVVETDVEVVVSVESTVIFGFCRSCGVRAEAQARMRVDIRDLACFGRPARLVWNKRRWRCRERLCPAGTWTEHSEHVDAQAVLTRRAGIEACRQVGENARPVAQLADELGVCWWTIMNAVIEHGTPLVDDPERVGPVSQLGVDETSFLAAKPSQATVYVTGLVDLDKHIVIDMVEGNSAADLRRWTANTHPDWLAGIGVVATDLAESFRAGLSPHLDHARRVADPFHVTRVANRCVDAVRRRVQNETLGHRGRKHGSTNAATSGCCSGYASATPTTSCSAPGWPRSPCATCTSPRNPTTPPCCSTRPVACAADEVPEIRSLGHTLKAWRTEILAHHETGASNGPTEGLNLCVKKVKRCGHGFRSFDNYRLRVLLHAGGITWPERPHPPRIRSRSPHSVA